MWLISGFFILILALMFLINPNFSTARGNNLPTLVITETGMFTSLDPLEGDSSQNLPVARMIYATPLEMLPDNSLGSRVLESFDYDSRSKTIHWVVKRGLTYSDGSPISTEDVAFAVVRMAFTRPGFPLIKLIVGLDDWLKEEAPLLSRPSGIKFDDQQIWIQLKEDYPHPMFRFGLELFAIIPQRCVDTATNKITCDPLPTSGYYQLVDKGEDRIRFRKRSGKEFIDGKSYAEEIEFQYQDATEAFVQSKSSSKGRVILSSEAKVARSQLKEVQSNFHVGFTPAAWFTILQINPGVAPFDDSNCRRTFAEAFKRNYHKASGELIESSVFTKLVAGYKTNDELVKSQPLPSAIQPECLNRLKGAKVPWGFESSTPQSFAQAVKATVTELGIELSGPTTFASRKEEIENFISGQSAFLYGRTGFWALDPTGDIQMLFTPNLHKGLRHFWDDKKLQSLLGHVVQNGVVNSKAVNEINEYLFSDAKFNVYSHIRRFYASKDQDLIRHLPIGITSPAPWQLFEVR